MQLREYQQRAVEYAADFARTADAGKRMLLASPTGTGKSYMEIALQDEIWGSLVITPKLEIIVGLLAKRGIRLDTFSEDFLIDTSESFNIYTPIRLRNKLLAGEIKSPPLLILDEVHHDSAESWQDIHLLCGYPPAVGFTATPYRGTPRSTAAFRADWGDPVWVITLPEAVEAGDLSMPICRVEPLVDDDLIDVQNGELVAKGVESAVQTRLDDAARLVPAMDTPTMCAVPSVNITESLRTALERRGVPSVVVTGITPHSERQKCFRACLDCSAVLIQVAVVSEGVDLPIRRLIDLSPTLSPVKWLQQFGRITRPGGQPEYICTNRNLLRHGYLLDGVLPASSMVQAQAAFPPSTRSMGLRAVGLEAVGRFKPAEIPLKSGLKGLIYSMSALDGHKRTDYAVIVHPTREDVIWSRKDSTKNELTGELVWGRWYRCEPPNEITGFQSLPPSPLSEKQKNWWKRSAASRGLDADADITRKQFPVLPVLCDLKVRL